MAIFGWDRLLQVPGMGTLISILIGFGLAAMFRPLCKGPDCIIMRGPPVGDIKGAVYQFGSKCVEFDAKAIECPSAKGAKAIPIVDTLTFADIT
jgi:hypothetical protein